jgi:spermidine synthase
MIGRISVATVTSECSDSFSGSGCAVRESDEIPASGRNGTAEVDAFLDHIDGIDREQRWHARFEAPVEDFEHENHGAFIAPLVFELGDIRSLLANWAYVQSAMSISDPFRLMLDYTRAMMAFLLFKPLPNSIEIIGLGGGSLAKYCHKYLPDTAIRGVEVDPDVIAVGDQFYIPQASERFETIWADGFDFVARDERKADIILIDGFDKHGQPPQLCSLEFYRACRSRLNPGGIFVANLCDHPWKHLPMLARMRECFGQILTLPVEEGMNRIVFAFKDRRLHFDRDELLEAAKSLELTHPLPLATFAEELLW